MCALVVTVSSLRRVLIKLKDLKDVRSFTGRNGIDIGYICPFLLKYPPIPSNPLRNVRFFEVSVHEYIES